MYNILKEFINFLLKRKKYYLIPILLLLVFFGAVIITGILATFVALLLMNWAQKILNPSETAIIFSGEPVAAAIFATTFGGEILGLWGWIGGGLVVLAVAYGESG